MQQQLHSVLDLFLPDIFECSCQMKTQLRFSLTMLRKTQFWTSFDSRPQHSLSVSCLGLQSPSAHYSTPIYSTSFVGSLVGKPNPKEVRVPLGPTVLFRTRTQTHWLHSSLSLCSVTGSQFIILHHLRKNKTLQCAKSARHSFPKRERKRESERDPFSPPCSFYLLLFVFDLCISFRSSVCVCGKPLECIIIGVRLDVAFHRFSSVIHSEKNAGQMIFSLTIWVPLKWKLEFLCILKFV